MTHPAVSLPRLILASASPRRQSLLREAGYAFEVHPSNVDEEAAPGHLGPVDLALHLANVKGDEVARQFSADVVLSADTVVALENELLGKPVDEADARRIITRLAGQTHIVVTGVAVKCLARSIDRSQSATSIVRMNAMSPAEINAYVATGRWRGKAGGYGIQDPNPIVACVSGSLSNVIGLPMELAMPMLNGAGVSRKCKA